MPNAVVSTMIELVSQADACLSNYNLGEARLAKLYAIAHLMQMQEGGLIKAEKNHAGSSATYSEHKGKGTAMESTRFGSMVLAMNCGGCISTILNKPRRFAKSFGK